MEYTKNNTLSEIVRQDFRASRVFEKHGLDFCCNGKRALEAACAEKGLDTETILTELKEEMKSDNAPDEKFEGMELDELVNHIVTRHHGYIKGILPLLNKFSDKVLNAHGKNHPELARVSELYHQVEAELTSHMFKEENMLFPFIVRMSEIKKNGGKLTSIPFGSVRNPISQMEAEHDNAGGAFHEMREITDNFRVPGDACNTFKSYYEELNNFEMDLHKHIHLENNILHPKAIETEEYLLTSN
ncbi:MAG TPA: iron-sulfur cluster repair di-iron protein [Ignavibacteria bacterium]|nr:iron-sulfur cluster repair di-iron protein [Ignavibacteria bacterium]